MGSIAVSDVNTLDIVKLVLPFLDDADDGMALTESVLAPKPNAVWLYREFHDLPYDREVWCGYRFKDQ